MCGLNDYILIYCIYSEQISDFINLSSWACKIIDEFPRWHRCPMCYPHPVRSGCPHSLVVYITLIAFTDNFFSTAPRTRVDLPFRHQTDSVSVLNRLGHACIILLPLCSTLPVRTAFRRALVALKRIKSMLAFQLATVNSYKS